MKKIALITNVVLLAIVCLSCKQNKPEPVVEKYFTHLGRAEYTEIKECVLEEHHAYYDLLEQLMSSQENAEEKPQVKVTNIKCEITGDTVAVCTCMVQIGDEKFDEQTIPLKKVEKVWLINQGKEGGMPTPSDDDEPIIEMDEEQTAEVAKEE